MSDTPTPDTVRTITWRGHDFTFDTDIDAMSIDALEAMENGKGLLFLREVLGHEQYAAMKRLGGTKRDLDEFLKVIAETAGFESLGN